jgi:adenosylhomocysteine nucleosidase
VIRVGFVTGLAVEAQVLRRNLAEPDRQDNLMIACAGADSARARRAAETLLETGAGALVSYGIAGGLDPALQAGAVVLAEAVLLPGEAAIATDLPWRQGLLALATGGGHVVTGGKLAGSDRALGAIADKRGLFEASGAVAVDMESHAVAEVAHAVGVPFLVLRAVADPADRPLPHAVKGSIAANGEPRPGMVLARLALRPWELPGLLDLRRDAAVALRALGRLTRALGPGLTGL